ncbi:MAG TPA: LysR substrate-binding domain-containing protein [Gammaproteobacteria bacterium]|nr:LysR substrate-binding domain-containing protein [Gammaproteobacteria bacterium]
MRPNVIRGLVVFCAAARYLSFKMAADDLCITPSAVSHQIKALEDLMGAPLFERRTRAIVLTPIGAALCSQTSPLLSSLDAVANGFLAKSKERRVLRISLPQFFASEMLMPRLEQFTKAHPTLDIHVDTTEGREHDFPGHSDAAVMLLPHEPKGFCVYPLFGVKLVPACSPTFAVESAPSSPAALGDCTLIIHKSRPDAWSEWFKLSGTKITSQPRIIELDSMFAVARAAERGLGVALVPVPLAGAWLRSETLVTLSDTTLDTGERYYFVHRPKDTEDPDISTLARWTAGICSQHE